MAKHEKAFGVTGLLLASFFWGAEFVVEKDILSMVDANYSNAIRFGIASLICTIALLPHIRKINRRNLFDGCITGLFMGLGFAFQTMGLKTINAGENAVLCSAYIMIIPLIEWFYMRKNPGLRVFIYAALAIAGIFLISYDGTMAAWNFSKGELLTLSGSFFYAVAIITINAVSSKTDPVMLTLVQFYVITIVSVVFAITLERPPADFSWMMAAEFAYLIFFATIGAQMLMNFCMKYVTSSAGGLIFSTESIFAAALGVIFLHETTTVFLWIGMALIVGTNILYQTGFPGNASDRIELELSSNKSD